MTIALDWLLYLLVLLVSLGGVAINVMSLPGNWVMFICAVALSGWNGFQSPHWLALIVLLLILLAAETVEFLGGMLGAKKFGASTAASWAAIAGAFIGGIIGIPFLMLGVNFLLGAILGAFLAAWIVETVKKRPWREGLKAAVGAALGRGVGIVAKIGGGLVAWIGLAFAALPLWK